MERDLSVLSIYPRIFLRVFIVYRLLLGCLFVLLHSGICSCVLVVLVCQYLPSDWLQRLLLMTPLRGEITSTKPR